jgi:hypothetical protein
MGEGFKRPLAEDNGSLPFFGDVLDLNGSNSRPGFTTETPAWYRFGTGRIVLYVRCVQRQEREGRMGRVGTYMAVASSGRGPSGRWFKSGLPGCPPPLVVGLALCALHEADPRLSFDPCALHRLLQ